jgi:two-component sensor histidine kinase
MSNSAKYAFKQQINPEIHIVINSQLHSKLQIKYQDNGGGLPTNFDMNKERQSFGLDFVNDLIAQHKGSITHENEGGAKFNITLHFK